MAYGSVLHELSVLLNGNRPTAVLLQKKAVEDHLEVSNLRSLAWRIGLGALPVSPKSWVAVTEHQRERYGELVRQHLPTQEDLDAASDPLSGASENPWSEYFKTRELREVIEQDVVRTHPLDEFFQRDDVRALLTNVLLVYAKENPELGYAQGMHELLAPVVFTVWSDVENAKKEAASLLQAADDVNEAEENGASVTPPAGAVPPETRALASQLISSLFSVEHLEADCFSLFERLMGLTRIWFVGVKPAASLSPRPDSNRNQTQVTCDRIQGKLLRQSDSELAAYLASINLIPQIYALRWIRVLYSREFDMRKQLLSLWDALFVCDDPKRMVEMMAVAMLIRVRKQLLGFDLTGCLSLLKDYPADPQTLNIRELVHLARKLNEGATVKSLARSLFPSDDDGHPLAASTSSAKSNSTAPTASSSSTSFASSLASSAIRTTIRSVSAVANLGYGPPSSSSVPSSSSSVSSANKPSPAMSDPLNASSSMTTSVDWERKYNKLVSSNEHVSQRLERLCLFLGERAREDENLSVALADLKQCKDILLGLLED